MMNDDDDILKFIVPLRHINILAAFELFDTIVKPHKSNFDFIFKYEQCTS